MEEDVDAAYFRALEQQNVFKRKTIRSRAHNRRYVLTLAGAGSGKTSVLTTSRWLFSKCKTSSSTKYFITYIYTKAAEEIRSRVAKLPGMNHAASSYVVAGTFHSVFLKLLRSQGYNQQILANENINKL